MSLDSPQLTDTGTDDDSEPVDPEPVDPEPVDEDSASEASEIESPPAESDPADQTDPTLVVETISRRQRRAEVKASAQKVNRVLRRIHPWSVLKVAFLFFLCFYGVVVLAALLLWRAAVSSETVDNIEEFVVDLGFQDFQFHPDTMFQSLVTGGAIMVLVATFFAVLTALMFNLIADVTGGIRITMIEQRVQSRKRVKVVDDEQDGE